MSDTSLTLRRRFAAWQIMALATLVCAVLFDILVALAMFGSQSAPAIFSSYSLVRVWCLVYPACLGLPLVLFALGTLKLSTRPIGHATPKAGSTTTLVLAVIGLVALILLQTGFSCLLTQRILQDRNAGYLWLMSLAIREYEGDNNGYFPATLTQVDIPGNNPGTFGYAADQPGLLSHLPEYVGRRNVDLPSIADAVLIECHGPPYAPWRNRLYADGSIRETW